MFVKLNFKTLTFENSKKKGHIILSRSGIRSVRTATKANIAGIH
jgi:hypothetical protein